MMRASGKTGDGRPLLVIGLERENIERLKAGRPIKFDMAQHGIVGECIIVFGDTAEDCIRMFTPISDLEPEGRA